MDRAMPSPPVKSLGAIRRKAVDLATFNPIRESQTGPEQPLPLIMEPASDQVDLADWARSNRNYIAQKLHTHGGILFRGFNLKTPQDFERVAAGVYQEIYAEYGGVRRLASRGSRWQYLHIHPLPGRQADPVSQREFSHEPLAHAHQFFLRDRGQARRLLSHR